jgi:hypothetical protein
MTTATVLLMLAPIGQSDTPTAPAAQVEATVVPTAQPIVATPSISGMLVVTAFRTLGAEVADGRTVMLEVAQELGRRPGIRVVTADELTALADHQAVLQLVDCDDASCMSRLAALANAPLVLTGSVGKVGEGLLLSLRLIDARAASATASASRVFGSLDELKAAVPELIDELLGTAGSGSRVAYRLPEGQQVSFAVFDIKHLGLPESVAQNLTQILAAEIKKLPGTKVVSRDDIVAMLQLEADKSRLGCTENIACLAEIGGALGVDKLVLGDAGKLGESYVISLRLIDVRRSESENRVSESFKGLEEQLMSATRHAARALLGVESDAPSVLAVTTSEAGAALFLDEKSVGAAPLPPIDKLTPGRHALRVTKNGYFDWSTDLYLDPGATAAVWAKLEERPAKWYQKWWFWTAVGVVVTGATVGTILLLQPKTGTLTVQGAVPGGAL